jgi:hypothetical protein
MKTLRQLLNRSLAPMDEALRKAFEDACRDMAKEAGHDASSPR